MFLDWAILLLFPAAVAFAGAMDLFTMTIPNRVPLLMLAGFLCLAPFAGFGWMDMAVHVGVGFAALLVGLVCFAQGWIGGGDAKLFAATALWLGYEHLLTFTIAVAIVGGLLTLAILLARMMPLPGPLARQGWLARLHDSNHGIPYGIALAAGALLVYPNTPWMSALA